MNDQDREEHRLAAKAAGYHVQFLAEGYGGECIRRESARFCAAWRPKTNRADSFDLLCAIYRHVSKNPIPWLDAPPEMQEGWEILQEAFDSGDSTAACSAVFSLAVATGRSMEEQENEQSA